MKELKLTINGNVKNLLNIVYHIFILKKNNYEIITMVNKKVLYR